jgi:hypothetical protein
VSQKKSFVSAVHVLAAMSAKECAGPVMEELMSNDPPKESDGSQKDDSEGRASNDEPLIRLFR